MHGGSNDYAVAPYEDDGRPEVEDPCVICGKDATVTDDDGNRMCGPCKAEIDAENRAMDRMIRVLDEVLP